jgi:hypothetical protein
MYEMLEPVAAWCGRLDEEFYAASSTSGLTIFTDIQEKEFQKYLVFGHNGQDGTIADFPPENAPADFVRTGREWYLNKGGELSNDVFINLTEAAGNGQELPGGEDASHYALLWRANTTDNFLAVAHPDQVFNENLIFNDMELIDGYYCLGYASTEIPLDPFSVAEGRIDQVSIAPNPANSFYYVKHGKGLQLTMTNIAGQQVMSRQLYTDHERISTDHLKAGMYFIHLQYEQQVETIKLILN